MPVSAAGQLEEEPEREEQDDVGENIRRGAGQVDVNV